MDFLSFPSIFVLLTFTICGSLSDPQVVITSTIQDVHLMVDQNQTVLFEIENSSLLNDSYSLDTIAIPNNVVKLVPSSVQIHKGDKNFTINIRATDAGKTTVTLNKSTNFLNVQNAFVRITVQHSNGLDMFCQIIGWIYFIAWSISFYPQIYENWKRKSVIGLSFDFLGLNVVGFFLYSLFNIGLYWITPIQDEYMKRHPTGVIPVLLNDVIFALHAVFACVITIIQCFIYERGTQSVSKPTKGILLGILILLVICLILAIAKVLLYLDFLYICSYVKLFITLIKYVPQAYLNFRRKSTFGWSIGNILLDFTGGFLSIGQMFVLAYNENDWSSIFGDPTKFGLGLFSVLFDILFILQHYVFYRNNLPSEELINNEENIVDDDLNHSDVDSQ